MLHQTLCLNMLGSRSSTWPDRLLCDITVILFTSSRTITVSDREAKVFPYPFLFSFLGRYFRWTLSLIISPLTSPFGESRHPAMAIWSLSRMAMEVPLRILSETASLIRSDFDKVCSSSEPLCCRGTKTLYTHPSESTRTHFRFKVINKNKSYVMQMLEQLQDS